MMRMSKEVSATPVSTYGVFKTFRLPQGGAAIKRGTLLNAASLENLILPTHSRLVGLLPAAINNIATYDAGPGTAQADGAKALIAFLHSSEAKAVFKARGLTPTGL